MCGYLFWCMEIGVFSHPNVIVIVIVIESYPLSNPRKIWIRMTLTWGNQLSWQVPCLWIRSLNEPTEVLDLEIAHLNEDRSSWGANVHGKNPSAAPEGKEGPIFLVDVCFYDLTPKGGFFWRFQGFQAVWKTIVSKSGFVCVRVSRKWNTTTKNVWRTFMRVCWVNLTW